MRNGKNKFRDTHFQFNVLSSEAGRVKTGRFSKPIFHLPLNCEYFEVLWQIPSRNNLQRYQTSFLRHCLA